MGLKFVLDHAWKFPSTPPLTLKCGAEGVSENPPEPIPGVSGGSPVHTPRHSYNQQPNTFIAAPPAVVRQARQAAQRTQRWAHSVR